MTIREYNGETDRAKLRGCVVELQDFERRIDPRMPCGEAIADAYIDDMLERCAASNGKVLVAEIEGAVAGYVTILTRVKSESLDDGDLEYGLIADLVVRDEYRRRGLSRKMIEAAESLARQEGVRWLRIAVLASNKVARDLYASSGFDELYVELEKALVR